MKLQITLKKSPISSLQVHKDTVAALGLRKVGQTVVKEDNACVRGQIFRVKHMIDVQEIKARRGFHHRAEASWPRRRLRPG